MTLVNMKEMLQDARDRQYGIGSFNIFNAESIEAVAEAAEELKSPAILAYGEVMRDSANIEIISGIAKKVAKKATVPIAFHLDHAHSLEYILKAIRNGFTSVMIDSSKDTFDINVSNTKRVVEICKPLDITVEAVLGHVGNGHNNTTANDESFKTVPKEVEEFVRLTAVDALAISIGNAHGLYKKEPKIDHDLLKKINKISQIPLVLHGGSGISDDDFRKIVAEGICKINIFTEMSENSIKNLQELLAKGNYKWILDFCETLKNSVKEVAVKRMLVFGSAGKA